MYDGYMLFDTAGKNKKEKPAFVPYNVHQINEKKIEDWVKAYRVKSSYKEAIQTVIHHKELNPHSTYSPLFIKRVRIEDDGYIHFFDAKTQMFKHPLSHTAFTNLCFSA